MEPCPAPRVAVPVDTGTGADGPVEPQLFVAVPDESAVAATGVRQHVAGRQPGAAPGPAGERVQRGALGVFGERPAELPRRSGESTGAGLDAVDGEALGSRGERDGAETGVFDGAVLGEDGDPAVRPRPGTVRGRDHFVVQPDSAAGRRIGQGRVPDLGPPGFPVPACREVPIGVGCGRAREAEAREEGQQAGGEREAQGALAHPVAVLVEGVRQDGQRPDRTRGGDGLPAVQFQTPALQGEGRVKVIR